MTRRPRGELIEPEGSSTFNSWLGSEAQAKAAGYATRSPGASSREAPKSAAQPAPSSSGSSPAAAARSNRPPPYAATASSSNSPPPSSMVTACPQNNRTRLPRPDAKPCPARAAHRLGRRCRGRSGLRHAAPPGKPTVRQWGARLAGRGPRRTSSPSYRRRAFVEREFGRLKNESALSPLRARGLDRGRLQADLTILAKLALGRARALTLTA
jgi:hypothetical protein